MLCSKIYIPRRRLIRSTEDKSSQGREAFILPLTAFIFCAFLWRAAGIYIFSGAAPPMNGRRGWVDFSATTLARLKRQNNNGKAFWYSVLRLERY